MNSQKLLPRLFGIFFILSFISYGIGSGLMGIVSFNTAPDDILTNKGNIIAGGLLIAIFHTIMNVGLVLIIFHATKAFNQLIAGFYLAACIMGTLMLAAGAIFLMLPLSSFEILANSNHFDPAFFKYSQELCSGINFLMYQFGMTLWGFGGLALCYLLYKSGIIPRPFSIAGFAGYIIFIAGTISELTGYPAGTIASIPGGLFEIALSVWLIVKGFPVNRIVE